MKRVLTFVVGSVLASLTGAGCGGAVARIDRMTERGDYAEAAMYGDEYLERHPDSELAGPLLAAVEEALLLQAESLDTFEAYATFRSHYPSTLFLARLDERQAHALLRDEVSVTDTLEAYRAYFAQWGQTAASAAGRARFSQLEWREVDRVGEPAGYWRFLQYTNDPELRMQAEQKLLSELWADAEVSGNPYEFYALAQLIQHTGWRSAALEMAETGLWDLARATGELRHYQALRLLFSDSAYAVEAFERERNIAWRSCEEADSALPFWDFAAIYPDDIRALGAERRALDLEYIYSAAEHERVRATVTQLDDRSDEFPVVYVDVRDTQQNLVAGLTASDFRVYESAHPAEVVQVVGMEDNRPVDVVFVVDHSGSMADEIGAIKFGIVRFAETLRARQRDVRLGLVHFSDTPYVHGRGQLTDDVNMFGLWVESIEEAQSGFENPAAALRMAAAMQYRPEAQRVVVLMTDEVPNNMLDPGTRSTVPMTVEWMSDAGFSLVLVTVPALDYDVARQVARAPFYDISGDVGFALRDIADRLSLQYQITYRSPVGNQFRLRDVRVRVRSQSTWGTASASLPEEPIALFSDPAAGCRIVAVLASGGIYETATCGEQWQEVAVSTVRWQQAVGSIGPSELLWLLDELGQMWTWSAATGLVASAARLQADSTLFPPYDGSVWVWGRQGGQSWVWNVGESAPSLGSQLPADLIQTSLVTPERQRLCGVTRVGEFFCVLPSGIWRMVGQLPLGTVPLEEGFRVVQVWSQGRPILLAFGAGRLYRSANGGTHWVDVRVPAWQGEIPNAWVTGDRRVDRVCAAVNGTVWCTDDAGLEWFAVGDGALSRTGVSVLAFGSSGGLYAADGTRFSRLQEVASREFMGATLFPTNVDEPYDEALPLLAAIAERLRQDPSLTVRVEGHTDSTGTEDLNQDLSERRATSVREMLLQQGAADHQVSARGFAATRPIRDNATTEGRQANRRVEILLLREYRE
jgi:Mg-chelatase subunit ChlD